MWRPWKNHSDRRAQRAEGPADNEVATAAARMLSGYARTMFCEVGVRPPAWAYVNVLAHSDPVGLAGLARRSGRLSGRSNTALGWMAACAYIAVDLLTCEKNPADIQRAQREVLIPIEIDLLAKRVEAPADPAELLSFLSGALELYRTRRSH